VYLHELDLRWHREGGPRQRYNARLVRFADDFVVLAGYIGEPIERFLCELLEGKMGLNLNREKTRILNMREAGQSLDFLGYTFRYDRSLKGSGKYVNLFPSKKAMARKREEVRTLTGRGCSPRLVDLIERLNERLISGFRYYSHGYPSKAFTAMDWFVQVRMRRFLRTRSQRKMRLPDGMSQYHWLASLGLLRLGDPRVMAYLRGQSSLPVVYRRAGCGKSARPVR
jgi:RNA-directed DNA polymerase